MRTALRPAVLLSILLAALRLCPTPQAIAADPDTKTSSAADTSGKKLPLAKQDMAKVPEAVRQALQDGKYSEAVATVDEALKAKDAPRDFLSYLKARALFLQQKFDDAIAAYETL